MGKVADTEQNGWQRGDIKEGHRSLTLTPLIPTGLPFFCQMKLWILTSTVSPVSRDTSRTLPPLEPVVNPIPGERALPPSPPGNSRVASPPSLTSGHPDHMFLELVTKGSREGLTVLFLHRCETQGLVEAAPGTSYSDTICKNPPEPGKTPG